jgi:hypothetical protein
MIDAEPRANEPPRHRQGVAHATGTLLPPLTILSSLFGMFELLLVDCAVSYLQKMARFSSSKPPSVEATIHPATASSLSRDGNVAAALDDPVEPSCPASPSPADGRVAVRHVDGAAIAVLVMQESQDARARSSVRRMQREPFLQFGMDSSPS